MGNLVFWLLEGCVVGEGVCTTLLEQEGKDELSTYPPPPPPRFAFA